MKPPYAILHRYRASEPQGSSERVLPWQVTMVFPTPTIYWYEVGMLKVPYIIDQCNNIRVTYGTFFCLKKNQNAPRLSEHPPVRGKKCQNVEEVGS